MKILFSFDHKIEGEDLIYNLCCNEEKNLYYIDINNNKTSLMKPIFRINICDLDCPPADQFFIHLYDKYVTAEVKKQIRKSFKLLGFV